MKRGYVGTAMWLAGVVLWAGGDGARAQPAGGSRALAPSHGVRAQPATGATSRPSCAGGIPGGGAAAGTPAAEGTAGFVYYQRQVLVPVRVNGVDAGLALIDTGATACAVDRALADRLGLKITGRAEVHGTAGSMMADMVALDAVEMAGRRITGLEATIYPLACPRPEGQTVGLIIGYPFLRHFAVEIDYPRRALRLHTEPVRAGRSVPLDLSERIPRIRAIVDGHVAADFRIDTGATLFDTPDVYFNITVPLLERLRKNGLTAEPHEKLSGSGVGGPVTLPVYRLGSLAVGGVEFARPSAIVQPAQGVFADGDTPGFIANYTLDHQGRVVIDYLDGTLDFPGAEGSGADPE